MVVKVSSKYQVVIPEEARRALSIKPGMKVDVVVKGGIAFLVPIRSLADLREHMAKAGPLKQDSVPLRDKKDRNP